ncbi:MAG TPA: arsenate reductase family protein [Sulfurimonas sp. UBA12504]|nr:MAG TPA: arsenate reductase family protein [Sulfurimonas sp. UBA12504]
MIEVYGIKNCDSVKKALAFFKKHHLDYVLHDFKTQVLGCDKINLWLQQTEIKKLFNSKSTTYRTLALKDKNLSEKEMIEWLCKENLLIKRPVIEYNNKLIIGFNETDYQGEFL